MQARRALRPDGLFIAALFGGETLHELRAALAEAEIETLGGLSPRVAPMGEIRDLGGLLQRAGFALPVADSRRFDVSYATPLALMRDLRAMGETNVMHDRLRRPMRRDMLARACAIYADALRHRRRPGAGDLRGDLPDRLGARRRTSRSRCAPARRAPGSPTRWAPPERSAGERAGRLSRRPIPARRPA